MRDFDPARMEVKWQERWAEADVFRTPPASPDRPRFYCLEMLPYPSGRIHMGHVRNYSIGDAVARYHRMRGTDVMHVIGWDAFGMPAENAAIREGQDPGRWTLQNIDAMRAQFKRLGLSYDWSREISTCSPEFYRWNQWFFLRMLERDIAYRARRLLNWCTSCRTVLANEQVSSGRCWRCDQSVIRREFDQWFLRITRYAQELLDDLDRLDGWPDRVRTMQRNWIGRSEGTRVLFPVEGSDEKIEVFTTRVDTIHGATYVALAVEHEAATELARGRPEEKEVRAFVDEQLAMGAEERFAEAAEKRGVFTGRHAVNPYSGDRIPVWLANFVLMDVGTGAIMSVPAHDQRDFEFARKYGLEIRPVIHPAGGRPFDPASMEAAWPDDGIVHDSGAFSGLASAAARRAMTAHAEAKGFGSATVSYRLKDWGVSRQRYWGTPIPVVYCETCGPVGVPDEDLPVLLPRDVPLTGEGGSPLAASAEFVSTVCPRCKEPARRETDTMDTFVDSSWYYFRYTDPKNDRAPFDWSRVREWFPVHLYIGGIEHATLHLIYTRFWAKVMRDLGVTDLDEPVTGLFTQGMVVKDGAKMSKSKGNVVEPDAMVDRFGADTTRLFSLFAAPPERDLEWNEAGVEGCYRFLSRVWRTYGKVADRLPPVGTAPPGNGAPDEVSRLRRTTHKTIRRVTDDLGARMHQNTAVSSVMELINAIAPLADREDADSALLAALREAFEALARLLSPLAPHIAEELWESLGRDGFVAEHPWPRPDDALLAEESVMIVVQVNGKLRARLTLARGATEEDALSAARAEPRVAGYLTGKTLRRVVHVPDRLLNLVVS